MKSITPQVPEHAPVRSTDLVSEYSLISDDFVKEMLSDMRVHSRQGIVQQINICLAVGRTGQAHPLLLTP